MLCASTALAQGVLRRRRIVRAGLVIGHQGTVAERPHPGHSGTSMYSLTTTRPRSLVHGRAASRKIRRGPGGPYHDTTRNRAAVAEGNLCSVTPVTRVFVRMSTPRCASFFWA